MTGSQYKGVLLQQYHSQMIKSLFCNAVKWSLSKNERSNFLDSGLHCDYGVYGIDTPLQKDSATLIS